jgi:3-hydroxyisobutyrate dehydrogenase
LLSAGFPVRVHNRTRSREEPLVAAGAEAAASPAEAARGADVVVTIVSDTPDVEAVLFGDDGVAAGARAGCVVVDMSTISPDATRSFGARLAEQGVRLVDAPVSGGSEGAEKGTLTIMVGGSDEDVAAVRPVLSAMGSKITHVGGLGAGQAAKAVNQVIVGGFYLSVAEGMALGLRSGLDMDRVLEAIGAGACRSWVLENRAGNVLRGEYPLGFRLALHLKDERIALDAARQAGVDLPLSAMVAATEERLSAAGFGDEDVSAVARAYLGG